MIKFKLEPHSGRHDATVIEIWNTASGTLLGTIYELDEAGKRGLRVVTKHTVVVDTEVDAVLTAVSLAIQERRR